jgi:hypothetical protein
VRGEREGGGKEEGRKRKETSDILMQVQKLNGVQSLLDSPYALQWVTQPSL